MSIATKTGDNGTTGLMYAYAASPNATARVESLPEPSTNSTPPSASPAAHPAPTPAHNARLEGIQKDLVILMGELATQPEDLPRYAKDGYTAVTAELTAKLDLIVREIESQKISFKGWATPGANVAAATLDVARTACRRAERRVCALQETGQLQNMEIIIYLNRLSDALWLMARQAEPSG